MHTVSSTIGMPGITRVGLGCSLPRHPMLVCYLLHVQHLDVACDEEEGRGIEQGLVPEILWNGVCWSA